MVKVNPNPYLPPGRSCSPKEPPLRQLPSSPDSESGCSSFHSPRQQCGESPRDCRDAGTGGRREGKEDLEHYAR